MAIVTVNRNGTEETLKDVTRIAFDPPNKDLGMAHLHTPGSGYRVVKKGDIKAVTGTVVY